MPFVKRINNVTGTLVRILGCRVLLNKSTIAKKVSLDITYLKTRVCDILPLYLDLVMMVPAEDEEPCI